MPNLPESVRKQVRNALSDIGYSDEWVHDDYSYANLSSHGLQTQVIELAAFAQYPPNYRDACIGITQSSRESDPRGVARHRGLGAPLIFEVERGVVHTWSIRADAPPEKLHGDFKLDQLANVFVEHIAEWSPRAIRQARRPNRGDLQLDFIDVLLLPRLAAEFQARLKFLLEGAVEEVKRCFRETHKKAAPSQYLFPFLFRFVMAKVFRDRNDVPGWESDEPRVLLEVAEKHCHSGLIDALPTTFLHRDVLQTAWTSISTNLHFQNFSLSDLFFIYESCFIDRDTRRELGVHNTPLEIADYVLAQLPIESLPLQERKVIEPFCGSGVFLASALKRLAELYPAESAIAERHSYLQSHLVGIEKESLAIEVCRLVLTLVDYPNPNGWRLYPHDVFEWGEVDRLLAESSIVVANPPFEEFTKIQREGYRSKKTGPPAEFLRRVLLQAPAMFGIVLPRSFTTAPDYREANRAIAREYGEIRTVELPENTFHYARVPTVLLLAFERSEHRSTVSLQSSVVKREDLAGFYNDWRVSESLHLLRGIPDEDEVFSLWVNSPSRLPVTLRKLPVLGAVCDIHKGLNWRPRTDVPKSRLPRADVVKDFPEFGFMPGCEKMEGCLLQFRVGRLRYLSLRDEDQDPSTRANRRAWDQPKAVCNAARSAEPWRLRGYADNQGLAFSKQYFALWPIQDVSVFAIAALLCSPLASRFSVERDKGRDNRIETLRELPIPPIALLRSGGEIALLSEQLHAALSSDVLLETQDRSAELCLRLDAAILDAYGLSANEQRSLLDSFTNAVRPTPFEFEGYFPEYFSDQVRLSELVAVAFDWDVHNSRRLELIDREFEQQLSPEEAQLLDRLQRLAFVHTSLMTPLPLKELINVRAKTLVGAA